MLDYLKTHLFTIPFFISFVLFAMDMSGLVGNFGYIIYYPAIILFALYMYTKKGKIDIRYVFFLFACICSICFNEIPSFFRSPYRFTGFLFLFFAFSGLYNNRKLALIRLHTLYIFSLFTIILVLVNYICLKAGWVNSVQKEMYETLGYYAGSTGNNEMGSLGAISILVIATFYMKFSKKTGWISKLFMIGCLVAAISMMAMASSRMALFCVLVSLLLVIYKNNRNNFGKFLMSLFIAVLLFLICAAIFGDLFTYMFNKQGGNLSAIDTSSRDEIWQFRMQEFRESPIWGVGFASARYWPSGYGINLETGVVELGSGWLAVLSQLGLFGFLSLMSIVLPNIVYVLSNKSNSYVKIWILGITAVFVFQPFTEAYITSVGAVLCCIFWLCYGVIDSFRKGLITEKDLTFKL